jgi:tripartite motif-containing protein 71
MRKIDLQTFLIAVLILLVALTGLLIYFYYSISKKPVNPVYETKTFKHMLSIYGTGVKESEQLLRPSDVAFDKDGNLYIADTGHARVLIFDQEGNLLKRIGSKGVSDEQLMEPIGIAVAKDGRIYVADKALNKVLIFKTNGEISGLIKVNYPLKPMIVSRKLYLTTRDHIMVFDLNGKPLSSWGQKGQAPGEMDSPTGIAVDVEGNVYISDTLNLRIQSFTKGGKLRWAYGRPAKDIHATDRKFGLPVGLTLDGDLLFVIDAFNSNIRVFNTTGKPVTTVGKKGKHDGEFSLPSGIAYDQNHLFAVSDKFNNRVQLVKIYQ